ncbi:hypothetical protein CI109_104508 [Kwoniella shandongensis]|uniref:2'-phosphotransferase n=1 Tax=Kwoniella shandongensis TaxID=1734106 RepID=A0A5M6BRU3_9TREE|nr:uncharacterized protein CI109_006791 [Kwoniella shandongensis]KAA5524841.1 hypothetical protein CI109_006791 [Kwoniella shandongensis]
MPRPPETPDVKASKALAYILRHGAEKESLHIRSDGYIKLADVLARPKMREVDLDVVLRLVAENAKQRFELFYGYDPIPPRPKKKGGQGKGKGQGQGKKGRPAAAVGIEAAGSLSTSAATEAGAVAPISQGGPAVGGGKSAPDAATIDDIRNELSKSSLDPTPPPATSPEEPPELPLQSLPRPTDDDSTPTAPDGPRGEYFIRATQGHSIKLESTAHLEPVKDDEEGRRRAGELVHGTRWELWDVLKNEGLSRMTRQHIHLAPSFTGPITPRPTSTLYIHLDLPKLVKAGIPVYTSSNGVVLTPGGEGGIVGKEFWRKAVRRVGGKRIIVWEEGKEVEREEIPEENGQKTVEGKQQDETPVS